MQWTIQQSDLLLTLSTASIPTPRCHLSGFSAIQAPGHDLRRSTARIQACTSRMSRSTSPDVGNQIKSNQIQNR